MVLGLSLLGKTMGSNIMRSTAKHLFKLACFIGLFLFSLSAVAKEHTVRLCFENTSNPPFYYGENMVLDQHPGLTIDVLRAVAKVAGVSLELERMPWKRCILLLKKNQIDGAFEISYKPQRESYAVYPKLQGKLDQQRYLHSLSYYLYTLDDSPMNWDGKRIENINSSLAAVAGYSIIGDLRAEGYPVLEGVSQKANLEMLWRGRVGGLAQIDTMTDGIIKNSRPDKFTGVKKHPIPLRSKLYYLVFSKQYIAQNKPVAEAFWDALANFRRTGRYDDMALKYAK